MAKVKDLMSKHIVGVSTETTVDSAMRLAKSMHVNLIPVISDGRLEGVALQKDFEAADGKDKVKKVMHEPLFVESDNSAEQAAKLMVENAVGRLPVVDSKKGMRCVGIISSTDIVKSAK
ncbi:MAG: CBS domain-containing protein [Candidatus Micrarchaeota archaeon]|nr:CBS domain-containing protein [Candidatus Micrarchaeota archaeon]MDE1860071.1 CBS domain-containing protein [Candidatus Micrarchaeota archaeon]